MPLSWNEIRQRAITFARDWSDASRERAEAQTFWNEFFQVFGKSRRAVASFEEPVHNLRGDTNFIDLLWKGRVIAEHKSRGRDLGKAHTQAVDYIQSLINDDREDEAPRYILVSDFAKIAIHDLDPEDDDEPTVEFTLDQLHEHIRRFAFIAGYETRKLDPEDPANLKAADLLANLHDRLEDGGYAGHDLQRFMVRVLFCLFAEDTGIFEPDAIKRYITQRTAPDGSDLGLHLARIFQVLNKPDPQRQTNLDEDLAELPYVNGRLFEETLAFADFDSAMRTALLECCGFKWDTISPAVFGSLFQSIMEPRERRQIGAHYTSERDILKLIRSLFLDDLRDELDKTTKKNALDKFIKKLGALNFLDPACGCGNFLVLAYRELRRLEMDAIAKRYGEKPDEGDLRAAAQMSVDQFYGIEIEEWPALIAEVAMWLMDHQMNNELFARFGSANASVPLKKSPTIRCDNALRIDWDDVLPADDCSFIMGNPPFVGKKERTKEQSDEMAAIFESRTGTGTLDYVTTWYEKSTIYANHPTRIAFVSTNSITQGEQPGNLWPAILDSRGYAIHFAHRTFPWESEARGRAHVHVVIIGFGATGDARPRMIHDYGGKGEPLGANAVSGITPYLTEGVGDAITNISKPLNAPTKISYGSFALDDGNYTLSPEDYESMVAECPATEGVLHLFIGARELLHGERRYCVWLNDIEPNSLRRMPAILKRINAVRTWRRSSGRAATRKLAATPARFAEIRQPSTDYVAIPTVSSERRDYIPMAYLPRDVIASNQIYVLPDATEYHFGVLYSAKLVYNNFPWPEATETQRAKVEAAAQGVLDARANHPDATLADLYDPLTMPADLAKAHAALDRVVDRCYRAQPFPDERRRFEHLFALYEKLTAPLTAAPRKTRRKRNKKSEA